MTRAALVLALVWGCWRIFFGIAARIGGKLGFIVTVIHAAVAGLIFLATAAVALKWRPAGAILLVLEGLAACVFYSLMALPRFPVLRILPTVLAVALPPLVAGTMVLVTRCKATESHNKPSSGAI